MFAFFTAAINQFDAIVFHVSDMENGKIRLPDQRTRNPEQRYIMVNNESPLSEDGIPYEKFKNFFNWTMTYRRDREVSEHGLVFLTRLGRFNLYFFLLRNTSTTVSKNC